MERMTMIEKSAAAIGQTWTRELHAALVHHIGELEQTYTALLRRRDDHDSDRTALPRKKSRLSDILSRMSDTKEAPWESGLILCPRPQWRIRIADTFTIDSYAPRPCAWRRFWIWALLGWTWEEVPRG